MSQDKKVILFPQLQEQLLDRGYAALNERNFEEAYELFMFMKINGAQTPQSELAIVICLVELGRLEEALTYSEKVLHEEFSKEVLDVYISILLQINEFEKVKDMIAHVLENIPISRTYQLKLESLLQLAEKGVHGEDAPFGTKEQVDELEQVLLHETDVTKQMGIVGMLEAIDVSEIMDVLKIYLQDETKSATLKSLIIQILNNKEVNEEMTVCKFGREATINPKFLEDEAFLFGEEVSRVLAQYIEHENPTMYQALHEQWSYYVFIHYPFVLEPIDRQLWVVALYVFGAKMYGTPIKHSQIEEYYFHHEQKVDECVARLLGMTDSMSL